MNIEATGKTSVEINSVAFQVKEFEIERIRSFMLKDA